MSQPASASTPGVALLPDTTGIFTAAHLAWTAVLAVLAIVIIVWGLRQRRRRAQTRREVEEYNAEVASTPPPARRFAPPPATVPPPHAAAPETRAATPLPTAAPAPPPLADRPVPGLAQAETAAADGPVTQLKGLGPKVAGRLAELGVTTVGQVAALTDDEAAALDARLGPFAGRMARDRWQEQARFLAAGDRAGFEAVFGRL